MAYITSIYKKFFGSQVKLDSDYISTGNFVMQTLFFAIPCYHQITYAQNQTGD